MDDDPYLWKMEPALFHHLQIALDEHSTYKRLLDVIPPMYIRDILLHIEVDGCKPRSTPAKVLLGRLGSQGVRVSMMIEWLEAIGLEKILVLLKDDEPIEIVTQPQPLVQIVERSSLRLTCHAKSFPSPTYQWFKGTEELLLQQESTLSIPDVSLEDFGTYICRVHTMSVKSGRFSHEFSTPSKVVVVPTRQIASDRDTAFHETNDLSKIDPNGENQSNANSAITIFRKPVKQVEIAAGGALFLCCEGRCRLPVKYQWYCNGRPVTGATSAEFIKKNVVPDSDTGESKWNYQCEVYHDFGKILSDIVNVEVLPPDEDSQYFAVEKVALLIGNDKYENLTSLRSPPNDVVTIANILYEMGFKVIALRNLTHHEMLNAVSLLCETLRPNSYVLVFFAGHGFELYRQVYLQPVDCDEEPDPESCLCIDKILACLQKHHPALVVLLIDTCRTKPFPEGQSLPPGKNYFAETKPNTVYGFATSSMCPSHECDMESNSFFVKYLKEFLPQKTKIQEVLYKVQSKFKSDPLVSNLQCPFVGSNLQEPRCLRDEVESSGESLFNRILAWTDFKNSVFLDWLCEVKQYDVEVILEFQHHMGVFCNGMDIHVYLDIGENAVLDRVNQMEFVLHFNSEDIQKSMKQLQCEADNEINSVCKQVVYQLPCLQNIQEPLDGRLVIIHRPTRQILSSEAFSFRDHPISKLKLSEICQLSDIQVYTEMNIKHDINEKTSHSISGKFQQSPSNDG